MHVLMLPSWYRTVDKPWRGLFVRDQATALSRAGVASGIAFVERRSLWRLGIGSVIGSHFQTVIDDDGVPIVRMKGWSTFAQTLPGSKVWAHLMRRVVRTYTETFGVPDVIHGHAALWGGYAAMLSAQDLGRPYVVTEHSSSIMTQRISQQERLHAAAVYRNAAHVIAVSGRLKNAVDGMAARDAEVIANTVDTDYFCPPRTRRRTVPFTFLAVCDLVGYKRVDVLIRAFAQLRARKRSIRLIIVGAGKDADRLRDLAAVYGVADAIRFTGALDRRGVREQMWTANALVLPSSFETFGVVLIEAMATGLPVLATRCGGPEEIVTAGTGILVPPGDEEQLAGGMAGMMRTTFDAGVLRRSACERFGYPPISAQLIETYQRLAGHDREVA